MELTPGYKYTEVGVIPQDWEIKRIVDLNPRRPVAVFVAERQAIGGHEFGDLQGLGGN